MDRWGGMKDSGGRIVVSGVLKLKDIILRITTSKQLRGSEQMRYAGDGSTIVTITTVNAGTDGNLRALKHWGSLHLQMLKHLSFSRHLQD
jgi:hypothetical protein